MKKEVKILIFIVFLSGAAFFRLFSADITGMKLLSETDSFRFYARDESDYSVFNTLLDKKCREFERIFQVKLPEKVDFYIYPDRKIFFSDVLLCDETFGTTTAMADHVNYNIYLSSPYDDEVRKLGKDMKKVAVHELVHLYFPSGYIFIREGMAEYYSDRLEPAAPEDIPDGFFDIRFYVDGPEETRKAYNISGWMMKFIIEECLEGGLENELNRFRQYCKNPDDYPVIGFENEQIFFKRFGEYLGQK